MAQRGANEGTVNCHLWDSRAEVVSISAAIVRNPRREKFLQSRQCARSQHLRAKRIRLELFEIGLLHVAVSFSSGSSGFGPHSQVALLAFPSGQSFAYPVGNAMLATPQ